MAVSNPHIVVLNDSDSLLQLFRATLEDADYRVTTDKKLYESVDDLVSQEPDLLLMDFLHAGDTTGWQFLQAVHNDPRCADLPIVLCTTGGQEVTQVQDDLAAMGVAVILKPFDIEQLLAAIDEQLAHAPGD